MPTKKEMIVSGYYNTEALGAAGSFEYNITAAGNGSQANGYKLTACNSIVKTASAGATDSVVLPLGDLGDWIQVFNYSTATIKIFPPVGWAIHGGAQNASISVGAGKTATFTCVCDPNKPVPAGFTYYEYAAAVSA